MMSALKVFRRVFVLRRITTANVSALQAEPEVNPGIAHFEALFTAASMWSNFLNLTEMLARRHVTPYLYHGGLRGRNGLEL
jgi:hypothetical protein